MRKKERILGKKEKEIKHNAKTFKINTYLRIEKRMYQCLP